MAKPVVRTLETYSIHGHIRPGQPEEDLVDYLEFFNDIANADPRSLRFTFNGETVAISDISDGGDIKAFRFVSGRSDELPLVYDLGTGRAESVDPGYDRFVVNGIWVIVAPGRRLLFAERKRPGVPISQLEKFFTSYGRNYLNLDPISISLNPVPSRSFADEVAKFVRIREATITLRRPNHSWTHSAENMLNQLGDSNAAQVSLQLNADSGQSLSKTSGLVHEVMGLAARPINALKNAVIKGTRPDFEGERSVSLRKHTVKGSVRIDPQADPLDQLRPLVSLSAVLAEQVGNGQDEHVESTSGE